MFLTYQALEFVDKAAIPSNAIQFFMFLKLKFLPGTSLERMSARLCAMEVNSDATDSETAYAATGERDYLHLVQLRRYDIPGAFLQCHLTPENCPNPLYGILPPDLPLPFAGKYVRIKRGVYGDRCKFLLVCPTDTIKKVIINTHVDDGGVIHTWQLKYDEVLHKLNQRYPGTIDESVMDRYLGMGFHFNSETGALTASMLHSVMKLLATASTETL